MFALQRLADRLSVRALAFAAAGIIGLAAFGDAAHARGHRGDYAPPVLDLERRDHGHYRPGRDHIQTRCEAVAFRRGGAILGGTHGDAVRSSPREACWAALAECERKLDKRRRFDRFPYPFARCDVINTQRIARRDHRGGFGIVLRF